MLKSKTDDLSPAMSDFSQRYAYIEKALEGPSLFEDKTWILSPEAWRLTSLQCRQLEAVGKACAEFYEVHELLYRLSVEGRNLLRNGQLQAPWVAEYLDRGKPPALIEHGRRAELKGSIPRVLRPDLLITEEGFALTELDSVPGGVGLTAFLNGVYAELGEAVVGSEDAMIDGFYASLAALKPDESLPLVAITVSEEAATYRPEYRWLAEQLRKRGKPVYCLEPHEIMPLGKTLCAPVEGSPEKIDVLYRFFELFDLRNIPTVDAIFDAVEANEVVVTPPMRSFQEEKLSLALFHHPLLEQFWREHLSKASYRLLKQLIPQSWIVDPVELPPCAVLHAPRVSGQAIARWEQLAQASQKDRNLILKISGFHEEAWGARSVVYGSDVSREEWAQALVEAVDEGEYTLRILQEYKKPMRIAHPIFTEDGQVREMQGRVRLCPYYYIQERTATLTGVLATFCPADKKIIHGMSDAALLPCKQVEA